jgi:hypothetical protein
MNKGYNRAKFCLHIEYQRIEKGYNPYFKYNSLSKMIVNNISYIKKVSKSNPRVCKGPQCSVYP